MYEIAKSVIELGRYELVDMLAKLDTLWLQGGLTAGQREELVGFARDNAAPEASYAPLQAQVDALAGRVDAPDGARRGAGSRQPGRTGRARRTGRVAGVCAAVRCIRRL